MTLTSIPDLVRAYKWLSANSGYGTRLVFQSGKLRLLTSGGFFQVEYPSFSGLPDFALRDTEAKQLVTCLDEVTGTIDVNIKGQFAQFGNPSTYLLKFPLATADKSLEDLDSILLVPLMTSDYEITSHASDRTFVCLKQQLKSLYAINDVAVNVRVSGDSLEFSFTEEYVQYFETLPATDIPLKAIGWTGNFRARDLLRAITMPTDTPSSFEHPLQMPEFTIRFSENSQKQLSPLMLQLNTGVTAVLAPVWQ